MSISFHFVKMDCAFSCNFLSWFSNGLNICVLRSGNNENETYMLVGFFYNRFIYDNEVDIHENF
jgi:hypothetical protein